MLQSTDRCMYGHTYSKSMGQPGKVVISARGQLNRENEMNISLSTFAPENLVSRDGFVSPVPRQPAHLHTQAECVIRESSYERFSATVVSLVRVYFVVLVACS